MGVSLRIVTKPYTYTPEGKAAIVEAARRLKGKRVHHWETCAACGKTFDNLQPHQRKSGIGFCSLDCCNTHRRGVNNPAWRGGYRPYYGPDWRPAQRAARKRDAYTCQQCGITQKALGRQLDVHHIAPVSSFTNANDANTLNNLVTLCHSCHMTVEWEAAHR